MSVVLGPHQLKAIEELGNGKILAGGVGSGKSRAAIAYYLIKDCGGSVRINGEGDHGSMSDPKDLYIITTARKREELDWQKEAAPFGISTDRSSSISSVKLTVDSWNNIGKYLDVQDAFFILDEQRLVGSGIWVKTFLKIAKKNNWILLSATPGDVWMDYYPVFQANGFFKNKSDFTDNHIVYSRFTKFPKIDRYVGTGKLLRLRRQLLVEMPVTRHTKRHLKTVITDYNKELWDVLTKKRWHIYEERPVRDISELFSLMRRLVNSDPSRIKSVLEIYKAHPKLIIFYNFNYELEELRKLGGILGVPLAEWNGHKHEPVPDGDSWVYLVQYTAGAEAWNCITTDVTIFYSLNYSYKVWEQAQGRIDRLNTPYTDLYYYILRSSASIDMAIMKSLKNKETFNEKKYYKE